MKDTLTFIGFVFGLAQAAPYWRAALAGKARPNMVSWFTWTLLTLIVSSAAIAEHNWRIGLIVLANALGTASVVLLGFWKGYAKMTLFDGLCQAAAFLGLLSWPLLRTPILAVIVAIFVDAAALLPTLRHAYLHPEEEAWGSYAFGAAGSFCGLLAVSSYAAVAVLYPAYLLLADGSVVAVLLARRGSARQ